MATASKCASSVNKNELQASSSFHAADCAKFNDNAVPQQMYESVDASKEIRLVRLLPAAFDNPVQCELIRAPLEPAPRYEALSYTWGEKTSATAIGIDGLSFHPTENLHDALRHLRYDDAARLLWIDAICVNQRDVKERGQHVSQMNRIYQTAARVVVWLGLESRTSAYILDKIDKVGSAFQGQGLLTAIWHGACTDAQKSMVYSILNDHLGPAQIHAPWVGPFAELLRRDWWQRVWVQQEFAFAKKAHLSCGASCVDSEYLVDILTSVFWFPDYTLLNLEPNLFPGGPSRIAFLRRRVQLGIKIDLHTAVNNCGNALMKSSDPRDRIFANLGFADNTLGISPRYELSVEEVFTSFIKAILGNSPLSDPQRFRILQRCQCPSRKGFKALPSWVQDWTKPLDKSVGSVGPAIEVFFTAAGFQAPYEASSRERLSELYRLPVHVKRLGILSKTCKLPGINAAAPQSQWKDQKWLASSFISKILKVAELLMKEGFYSDNFAQTSVELACAPYLPNVFRYLTFDKEFDTTLGETRANADTFERFCKLVSTLTDFVRTDQPRRVDLSPDNLSGPEYINLRSLERGLVYRSLFTYDVSDSENTFEEGARPQHVAIAPSSAQEGDMLCVIWGTEVPFVLRKSFDRAREALGEEERWMLIGDAYVDGIMDGEAAPRASPEWEEIVLE